MEARDSIIYEVAQSAAGSRLEITELNLLVQAIMETLADSPELAARLRENQARLARRPDFCKSRDESQKFRSKIEASLRVLGLSE
ncbi:MAG TPA: hypothetical protein VMB03_14340 [Bryobacteraceae bacterium]|nr:hypothetical protein [Bryobacteraceae bacterium]